MGTEREHPPSGETPYEAPRLGDFLFDATPDGFVSHRLGGGDLWTVDIATAEILAERLDAAINLAYQRRAQLRLPVNPSPYRSVNEDDIDHPPPHKQAPG